ncbi:ATP-dependent DNA helicase UvrD/PcrA/Rep, epsilon proteobacterial type 1 [Campylobacter jejuni]|nr:ATP-dependent DNA helicase UvrD/PcrA/Rep, epsilon proteobacterial type 1 [Campylobacter jejuni]
MPLSKLNNEQYLAATADFGRNLVIASAGTGKTSTIVARISYLLSKGVAPQKIML